MTISITITALVLSLVLLVIWFATAKGKDYITACVYCFAAVWLAIQLFLHLK